MTSFRRGWLSLTTWADGRDWGGGSRRLRFPALRLMRSRCTLKTLTTSTVRRRSAVWLPALVVLGSDGEELAFVPAESQGVRALQEWPLDDARGVWP